jgi:hypothetical protein
MKLLSSFLLILILFNSCKKTTAPEPVTPVTPVTPTVKVELKTADSTIEIFETVSGAKEAERLAQNFPASDFSTTGFYLPAFRPMEVEVTQINGNTQPTLLVGTYSRYESKWNPTSYTLKNGVNTITDASGGILYLRFNNENPSSSVKVRFISGMKPIPYFQLGKTLQADWVKMVDNITDVPDVQLVGKKTIITFSLANAKLYKNDDQEALIKKADRVIAIEDSISGLYGNDPIDQPNVHKYLMTESDHPGYFMAATFYRTWYGSTTGGVASILKADNLSWGPWHELGHMHQQGAWTWSELTEVTVNIYSIAVEKAFGITPTRLTSQNEWNNAFNYLANAEGVRNYNASNTSVWVRLCMFQQLKLAFGENFYQELHRQARRETIKPLTTDAKMRWFMLKACSISGKNLSAFFKKWGMNLSSQSATDGVHADIASLGLPAPTQDITLLRD